MKNSPTTIFSTGVTLQPVECIINGIKQWRWIAVNFEEDSFLNGECVIPLEYADKYSNLFAKKTDI